MRSIPARLREAIARRRRAVRRRQAIDRILGLRHDSVPTSDDEIARLREEVRRDAGL